MVGSWYSPDGNEVPMSGSGLHRIRGISSVAVTYSSSASLPSSGVYRCEIPDSAGQTVTLFAGLYRNGDGKFYIPL